MTDDNHIKIGPRDDWTTPVADLKGECGMKDLSLEAVDVLMTQSVTQRLGAGF